MNLGFYRGRQDKGTGAKRFFRCFNFLQYIELNAHRCFGLFAPVCTGVRTSPVA